MILPRSLPRRRTPCATAEQPKTRPLARPKPPTRQKRSWGQCGACGHPPPLPPVVGDCPTTAAPLRPPYGGLRPPLCRRGRHCWGRAASPAHGHRDCPATAAPLRPPYGGLRPPLCAEGALLGAGGEPRARPPSKTDVVGGRPPGSPLCAGQIDRLAGEAIIRPAAVSPFAPAPAAPTLRAPRSAPFGPIMRPSVPLAALVNGWPPGSPLCAGQADHLAGGAVMAASGPPSLASQDADSPSHRRRGRRLLRLDMRTLAHVCAPRLTWSASERPRSPRGPERAALRL